MNKSKKQIVAILGAFALAASACDSGDPREASTVPAADETGGNSASNLIPREALFGNPTRTTARVSPDGSKIAFVAPVDGILNAWVGPANNVAEAVPVTNDTDRGIKYIMWSGDGTYLLYMQDKHGENTWHIFATDVTTGDTRNLTPIDGASVDGKSIRISPKHPDQIVVGINDRDVRFFDLYKITLSNGERELLMKNQWGEDSGFIEVHVDNEQRPRLAIDTTPDGGGNLFKRDPGGDWQNVRHINSIDIFPFEIHGFDEANEKAVIVSSRDRNTSAVYWFDLATSEQTLIGANERADIAELVINPANGNVEAFSVEYDREEWATAKQEIAKTLSFIAHSASGDFSIVNRSSDSRFWVVHYDQVTAPGVYYLVDTQERKAEKLFSRNDALEGVELAKMHPRIIKSRDGLDLVSYLTLPPGSDPDQDGWPTKPVPLVLDVHGGPWTRSKFGFKSSHQWLANRGYAVLSVNFRGSLGFGKEFVEAATLEFAGKMHEDLIDAVDWAIATNITTADKVAIGGSGYGGYAALVGLTFSPDRFACGIDIMGSPNLVTLIESFPERYEPILEATWYRRVGDVRTEDGRKMLEERSPIFKADKIEKPLLIVHGAMNEQALRSESETIVQTMQDKGIPVTYLFYEDESMSIQQKKNAESWRAVSEVFLANCLGGEFEPIGDALEGSSVQVMAGAQFIEGLEEAVAASTSD